MKAIKMQCSNCGAMLELDDEKKMAFCPYCGSKLLIDDESISVNISYRDEAKIMEMEQQNDRYAVLNRLYAVEDKEFEERYAKWNKLYDFWKKYIWIGGVGWYFFMLIVGTILRALGIAGKIAQNELVMWAIVIIVAAPVLVAYFAFVFGGPYLYITNPKRKYMKQLQKREKDEYNLKKYKGR